MTFSIIGTGNIASFFCKRLMSGKHHCVGIYGRHAEAAKLLADELLVTKYGLIGDIEDEAADVCFIAVSDHAISEVAAQLLFKHTILVHTAGAVSLDILKSAAKDCAVLWPVYSILKTSEPGHRNIPCAWEASSAKAKKRVQEMGHAITDMLFEARYEQRKWLHLSAVISNNFTNHLMAICERICIDNNLPFSALVPIIEQTFERLKQASPATLQTGPAARNDKSTIDAQIGLLDHHIEWQNIYKDITRSIQSKTVNNADFNK